MIVNGIKLLRICSVYSSRIHSFSSRTLQRSIQLRVLNSRRMASSSDLDVDNRPTNELIHERSLYLLQHARNPVQWYPWGQAAFIRARNEKKLIFLSVGYSTCHWCHVMERESFENPEIAALMNSHFINIKVDREERPDIDRMYMTFVQLTSGNCGWPMSVFLTPDLNPVAGGTYFPPEDRWGHRGFKTVLQDIAKQWKDNPEKLKKTGEKVVDMLKKASTFEVGIVHSLTKGQVPEENCDQLCFQQLARQFDENFGGFDMSPKFPQPPNLNFLFHFYSRNSSATENTKALDMALKTLEMMAKGGIHDHVGQGFARYSVDEKWHVPHFEKMLYDQGQLAVAYATAFLITQRPLFKEILDDVLEYVERDLSFEKGGFFSAEDADSEPSDKDKEKREGAYYVWKYEEIADLLSKPVKSNPKVTLNEVFAHHYNVKKGGNVDPKDDPHGELLDKNVLIVYGSEKNTAEKFELSEEDLKFELDRARKILFEQRKLRPRPELDTKIITAWNGLMLSGYAKAAQVLDNEDYKERAIRAAKFVKMYLSKTNGELLHCCYTNSAKTKVLQTQHPIPAFLNDYAFLIRGLLDLYDCTYDPDYIEWSEKLQEKQNDLFWDNKHKAYNLNLISDTSVLLPLKEDQDGAEPSGNSVSVHNLIRLGTLLDKKSYLEKVEQILSVFTSRLTRFPISLPEMVSGLMFYHDAPMEIFIVGPQDHETTKEMLALIHKHYIPNRVLAVVDDDNSILYRKSETVRDMKDNKTGVVCAHVCRKRICSLPVTEVKSLEALLN